jgi:hypothetical protein
MLPVIALLAAFVVFVVVSSRIVGLVVVSAPALLLL